jgi:hypothetical protein
MYEFVKEYDMKNMNQNICNNEYKFLDIVSPEARVFSSLLIITQVWNKNSILFTNTNTKQIYKLFHYKTKQRIRTTPRLRLKTQI